MQDHNALPAEFAGFADAQVYTHTFLPIAAAYCRSLGLIELVNRMVPSQMEVTPEHVVQAMVLDVLSGITPLYRLEHQMRRYVVQEEIQLTGSHHTPHSVYDDYGI